MCKCFFEESWNTSAVGTTACSIYMFFSSAKIDAKIEEKRIILEVLHTMEGIVSCQT